MSCTGQLHRSIARAAVSAGATLSALSLAVAAQAQEQTTEERLEEVERRVEILAEELEGSRREALVAPGSYDTSVGVGPAGAKIYGVDRGLSIGGYGEAYYLNTSDDGGDTADFLRNVLYVGYRFSDNILLNTEIELEHADSAFVEFAYLDFLYSDELNGRAGLILTPLGFVNEVHEPQFFFGNLRPPVETQIIPTTSRENGAGIYGTVGGQLDYRLYVQNSFDGEGLSPGNTRGIRQKGSQTEADDLAVTGRLDWHPVPGLTLGGSFWTGDMGHDREFNGEKADINMTLVDLRAQYQLRGLRLRALYTQAEIDDTAALSQHKGEVIGERMVGWYAEAGYDVLALFSDSPERQSLFPWVRYSEIDTQDSIDPEVRNTVGDKDGRNDRSVVEAGLHYLPHPNVVVKAEYRDWSSDADSSGDGTNNQEEVVLGIGYNF